MHDVRFADEPLGRFLERVASDAPTPGGGAAAAVAAALAAGLVSMVARFSDRQRADAATLAKEADRRREEALTLAGDDAGAYEDVLAAYALPRDTEGRKDRIRAALRRATDVPLDVARLASEVAVAGASLVEGGNPNLKGDAVVAVRLAEAAVRGAATLVDLNVALGRLEGDWTHRSAGYLAVGAEAARRATAGSGEEG